jgi:hypothetical protein
MYPGAHPTTAIHNASAVKIYNAMSIIVRFGKKPFSSAVKKRSSLLKRWRCSCKFKSRWIGSRYAHWNAYHYTVFQTRLRFVNSKP